MSYLVQLRSFVRVFQTGSITAAAKQLNLTQPAVTIHIKALESFINKPLFVRLARGVEPTPAAQDLARMVAMHLDEVEVALQVAARRSEAVHGTVHIVGPGEFLAARIAPVLPPLLREGVDIRLQVGNRERIYQLLNNKNADMGIIASKPEADAHGFEEIHSERLILVAPADIADQLKAEFSAAQLIRLPFVAYDEDLPLIRVLFEQLFGAVPPMRPTVTAPDLRLLQSLVATGAGWSVLPDYLCKDHLDPHGMIHVKTGEAVVENKIYVIWRKGILRPPVAYVRDYLVGLANDGGL